MKTFSSDAVGDVEKLGGGIEACTVAKETGRRRNEVERLVVEEVESQVLVTGFLKFVFSLLIRYGFVLRVDALSIYWIHCLVAISLAYH